jgi:hypothetical protein
MIGSTKICATHSSETSEKKEPRTPRPPDSIWHCREPWFGDSRDGQFINGEGYHYFAMKGDGVIQKAIEWYESDDGEEHATDVPELVGINWFKFFGFEDEEILESIPAHEFLHIEGQIPPANK